MNHDLALLSLGSSLGALLLLLAQIVDVEIREWIEARAKAKSTEN